MTLNTLSFTFVKPIGLRVEGITIGRGGGYVTTNTVVGNGAGQSNTTGVGNTFIGYQAGQGNTTAGNNIFLGYQSGYFTTSGSANIAIGATNLLTNTTGTQNIAIGGQQVLSSTTVSSANIAIGFQSFSNLTAGSSNTLLGNQAGRNIADGVTALTSTDNSIYIGVATKALANSQTNQIVIGYSTTGLGSNTTVIGNSSTTLTALYGSLITGGTSVNASAQLQVDSTTKGFLPPRMTAAQRTAIGTPATGLIVYQTDGVEGLWLNTSTGWKTLTVV
jgi:hypothetical protein